MTGIKQWLQFLEQTGCFYREMYMLPLWKKYPNYLTDIWDSLSIFLEGYAFERQGRRPDYFHVGVDALLYCKQQHGGDMTQNVVNEVWQQFSQLLNNRKLNKKNNSLYPRQILRQKPSLIEVVLSEEIIHQNMTFATYLQNQINQNNDVQNAFNLVKSIRGIGNKIAAFYLRDLVDMMNIALSNTQNRHLLQPIDVWVERTVKILVNNQENNRNQIANWIVNTSMRYNVNPEYVNMGVWFFCSNIVGSEYKLRNVLNDLNTAQNLVNDFRMKARNVCQNC